MSEIQMYLQLQNTRVFGSEVQMYLQLQNTRVFGSEVQMYLQLQKHSCFWSIVFSFTSRRSCAAPTPSQPTTPLPPGPQPSASHVPSGEAPCLACLVPLATGSVRRPFLS
ncbi:hypothetical protein VPH35_008480 [Triticum aestivum]